MYMQRSSGPGDLAARNNNTVVCTAAARLAVWRPGDGRPSGIPFDAEDAGVYTAHIIPAVRTATLNLPIAHTRPVARHKGKQYTAV